MSTFTGFDMAPSALRWFVRDAVGDRAGGPIYGIRGCPCHAEYDSGVTWSDALSFREGEFTESYSDGVEKTVRYERPEGHASEWLRSFFQSPGDHPEVDVNGTIAVAVPDHASPEDRDEILAGLSATKYANVTLIWRPVAALLAWMDDQKTVKKVDLETLLDRRIYVLDLDGGRPELTELCCVRHQKQKNWIVPSRRQPLATTVSADDAFEKDCYKAALAGVNEWQQLLGGQFYGDLQKALESGDWSLEAWTRTQGAWRSRQVEFARELPKDILKTLNSVIAKMWKVLGQDDFLLVHGWIVRRYGEQILAPFAAKCGHVMAIEADSIARGAALFAERLAKGLPTFYDRIADYQFWDGFKSRWIPMFNGEVEVEPGCEYRYPEAGQPPRQLRVEKFSDNVSFYVRETNSKEYARQIKTEFAEFLRKDLDLNLSAVVSPEKGSARFVLTMCDEHIKAIFVSGKSTTREIVLRWSAALNVNSSVSIKFIDEHQGYVAPQPVLGRIYDSEDNLRMVEEYVKNPRGMVFNQLWALYRARLHPNPQNGIADRVGYRANPREPTRGLFGTRYVFSSRVDAATQAFAAKCAQERPFVTPALIAGTGSLLNAGMLQQNYCHCGALDSYKNLIRERLSKGDEPQYNFSFYNAAGYVLGEDPRDVEILLKYICDKTHLNVERGKLWWSFFRMLCWHPECKLNSDHKAVLEKALSILCDQDSDKIVHGGVWTVNDAKYLPLAILYALRIRESGEDLSEPLKKKLIVLLSSGLLSGIPFPQTMVPKVDPTSRPAGDTLSMYVLRFVKCEDTLADRELGAAMGGV